jgi:hypothetical protein
MRDLARQLYRLLIGDRIAGRRYLRELKRQIAEVKRGEREQVTVQFPRFD